MTRRILMTGVAGLLALLVGGASWWVADAEPRKKSPDLSGEWSCEGWNMGSDPKKKADYTIPVVMEAKGKDTYLVTWKLADGRENKGVGLYDSRTKVFAAGYSVGGSAGVAVWEISKGAKSMMCVGTFQTMAGDVAHERWTRK